MKKKKNYLDQFAIQKQTTSFQQELPGKIERLFQHLPIFEKTMFLKNPVEVLGQLNVSIAQLRLLKFIGVIAGGAWVFSMLMLSGLSFTIFFIVLLTLAGMSIGWALPELYLSDRLKTKRFFIQNAVPDFLDQFHLLVASPAYESFGQAVRHISPSFPGYLGDELRSLATLQPFLSEGELLLSFEKVCAHPLITELGTTIRVSNQFGSSLREKTAQLVQTAQIEREHRIKDLGNKTSGMLLGPLLLFHLPALLIIFLVPFLFVLQKGI